MVPSRVNEPLSCPGSGGSRDSAKGSARGGTGAWRPRLQTLLRGTRRGAGRGLGGLALALGAYCVILTLCHRRVLTTPGLTLLCSLAPSHPGGAKGDACLTARDLGAVNHARCSLPGPHGRSRAGRSRPGTKAAGRPAKCGLRPTLPSLPPPALSYLARATSPPPSGRTASPGRLPRWPCATTRVRPVSSRGRSSSAPWAPGVPSPTLALPAPPARGEMPPRRAGALLGREPGDRRCARPPPQELGDMLVNWFHSPPPSASCVHGSNLNWSLHLSRRIATLYMSVSPQLRPRGPFSARAPGDRAVVATAELRFRPRSPWRVGSSRPVRFPPDGATSCRLQGPSCRHDVQFLGPQGSSLAFI